MFKIEDNITAGTDDVHIATVCKADPEIARMVIETQPDPNSHDTRSPWLWIRLVILGCYPHGDTYFATEKDPNRP